MMRALYFLLGLLALSVSYQALAHDNLCTNANLAQEAPYFNPPAKKKFRHLKNTILSTLFQPQHVVHDLILNVAEPSFFVGKFDYDWVLHKDLEDEYIQVYLFADHDNAWTYWGRYKTNANGEIFVPMTGMNARDYLIRMVVEGDGSSVDGFASVVNPGHDAVVFDIDGTLTLSDFEMVKDYLSLATAEPYFYAQEVLDEYREKGYQLIFLTARPYWMASASRYWLNTILRQSPWPLKTQNTALNPGGTARYKADYLKQLINEKKLNIIRAYGNATTDIQAYALAGIPKKDTFIIGPNAGKEGTNALDSNYYNHYHQVVVPTVVAQCKQ